MRQLLPLLKTLTDGHELDEAITDWIEQCWWDFGLDQWCLVRIASLRSMDQKADSSELEIICCVEKIGRSVQGPSNNGQYCLLSCQLRFRTLWHNLCGDVADWIFRTFADRRTAKCRGLWPIGWQEKFVDQFTKYKKRHSTFRGWDGTGVRSIHSGDHPWSEGISSTQQLLESAALGLHSAILPRSLCLSPSKIWFGKSWFSPLFLEKGWGNPPLPGVWLDGVGTFEREVV